MKRIDPTILIVGHGRHGKDTLGNLITSELGYKFRGSSEVAAEAVVYPLMQNFYDSPEDAFNRRHENRELWRALISDFNREDACKLSRLVCEGGHGYTGLRDFREVVTTCKSGLFTHVIWIKRPKLKEDDTTMMFGLSELEELHRNGFIRNLAYVENHTEDVLGDVVKNELKEFLEGYDPNTLTYLRVDRKRKLPAS